MKFEVVWDKVGSRKVFQRQSVTKYLRLTLVFMKNSTLREKFNCFFPEYFASTGKIFLLPGGLESRLSFSEVWTLS